MPAAVTQPIYYHTRRLHDADGALTNRVEARQDGRLLFLLLSVREPSMRCRDGD